MLKGLRIFLAAVAGATAFVVAYGVDVTVTSAWDADAQTWIGNVTELTNALKNAVNNQTVYLSRGMYDLSSLTNAPMYSANGGGYGAALLEMPYGALNFEVVGATGEPDDVVLFANDSEYRILMMNKNPNYRSALRNVTIVGGNASEKHINTEAYRRGGGVFLNGSDKTVVSNCVFRGNRADKQGGAIAAQGNVALCRVIDCKVVSNVSGGDGGGIYNIALVANCTVVSNSASGSGGGIANCTFVTNTVISYNCANKGGGASNCALSDCTDISHNVATSWSDGGGLYQGSATNCVFRDNYASAAGGGVACLKNCDVSDMYVDAATIDSCVFHDISNTGTGIAAGNVSHSDGLDAPAVAYFVGTRTALVRNSLFANFTWSGLTSNYNTALFYNTAETGGVSIENCTFADNTYNYLVRGVNGRAFTMSFVNCIFADSALKGFQSFYMPLTNCAYTGADQRSSPQAEGVEDSGCFQVSRDDCKFVGKGDHPYSLKRHSSLRSRGKIEPWMFAGKDILGNPRLREGKVDIGCYQCWIEPKFGFFVAIDGHPPVVKELDTIYTVPHEFDHLVESGHIQGACCSEKAIYLSHSLGIDKIGWDGKLIKHVDAPKHLGDSAYADGFIYGACDVKDASLRVDGKPGLVRVWDEDLNVVADAWFAESLDGITVLGDTIYVGIAAVGTPHGTNYVKRLGRDLSDMGNVELDLGYWTKYGVQTMATDGESIYFGNYGAEAENGNQNGWNGSRLSPSLDVLENLVFPKPNGVSEGFDFVPKAVSRRSDTVFLRVGAASSQKEWNKTDHPPQIRIQFYSYKNGSFTLITK